MKKVFFVSMFLVSACMIASFGYAEAAREVDAEEMKNSQIEFVNAYHTLDKREQDTLSRQKEVYDKKNVKEIKMKLNSILEL